MGFVGFIEAVWQRVDYTQAFLVALTYVLAVLGAAYTFLTHSYPAEPRTFRGFLRFCLPPRILLAHQTRLDLAYAVIKKAVRFLWSWTYVSNLAFAYVFYRAFTHHAPSISTFAVASRPQPPTVLDRTVFLTVGIVVYDFFTFFAHYLMHRIPMMWHFHKVHHSALTLIPVTNRRFHPVQEVWDTLWSNCGIGVWIALYSAVMSVPLADVTILGINGIILANFFSFHHLRHSHIYMRYPLWLERLFMSPAQHQIHHSREERHLDRNFGLFLSCWDQLLGTIVYSEPVPVTDLGLTAGQETYLSVWGLFATPFIELERKYMPSLRRRL